MVGGESLSLPNNRTCDLIVVLNDYKVRWLLECSHQLITAFAHIRGMERATYCRTFEYESGGNGLFIQRQAARV